LDEFNSTYLKKDSDIPQVDPNDIDNSFARQIIQGTIESKIALEETITSFLKNKNIERVNKLDLTILLIGTFELLKLKEAPASVVINEAIIIAKKYGTKESSSLINGVLDSIAKNSSEI